MVITVTLTVAVTAATLTKTRGIGPETETTLSHLHPLALTILHRRVLFSATVNSLLRRRQMCTDTVITPISHLLIPFLLLLKSSDPTTYLFVLLLTIKNWTPTPITLRHNSLLPRLMRFVAQKFPFLSLASIFFIVYAGFCCPDCEILWFYSSCWSILMT